MVSLYFKGIAKDPKLNESLEKAGYKTPTDLFLKAKEHYLDSGTDTAVFTIPRTPFLLGIPTDSDIWTKTPEEVFKDQLFVNTNPFPGFQMGQSIARLGELHLRKRIPGFPNGVPRSQLGAHDQRVYREFEPKAYQIYKEKLSTIEQFPQKSYTDFAHFLTRIQSADPPIFFDPGANNILINKDRKQFRMIDPASKTDVERYHCIGNNLAGMTAALLDSGWALLQAQQYHSNSTVPLAETDPEFNALRKAILKKCIIAAHKADLSPEQNPFPQSSEMHHSHDLKYAFKLAGLTEFECHKVLSSFSNAEFERTLESVFQEKTSHNNPG
jgi:hypothetical protein